MGNTQFLKAQSQLMVSYLNRLLKQAQGLGLACQHLSTAIKNSVKYLIRSLLAGKVVAVVLYTLKTIANLHMKIIMGTLQAMEGLMTTPTYLVLVPQVNNKV